MTASRAARSVPDLEIRPVSPDMHDDLMRYFDLVAYADNPAWASCYCCERLALDFEERTKQQNRALRSELVREGRAYGLVAYRLGRIVGWCHAAPRSALVRLPTPAHGPRDGAIVCFVVAPDARRQGIATALLVAACDHLRGLGMTSVEAYPLARDPDDPARWPQAQYLGPMSMYRTYGFEIVATIDDRAVVRKRL